MNSTTSNMMIAEFSFPTNNEWDASVISNDDHHHNNMDEQDNDDDFSIAGCSSSEASKVLFEQWQSDDVPVAVTSTGGHGVVVDQSVNDDDDLVGDIMEVDEQINLLGDDIFPAATNDPCASPTGPLEELTFMNFEDDDIDRFSMSFLEENILIDDNNNSNDDCDYFDSLDDNHLFNITNNNNNINNTSGSNTTNGSNSSNSSSSSSSSNNIKNKVVHEETSSLPFDERYKATLMKLSESMKRSQETRMSLKMKTNKMKDYDRTQSVSGVLTSIEKSSQQLHNYLKSVRSTGSNHQSV